MERDSNLNAMMETREMMTDATITVKLRRIITAKVVLPLKLVHVSNSCLIDHTSLQQEQFIYSVELFKALD